MADDSPEPTSGACINLQVLRTSHYIMRAYDEAYRPLGVRATQMPVLGIIARRGPVTIRQIADEMESERSAISRKLRVMEQNGWIREDPGASGKEKAFVLDVDGRKVIERILPLRLEVQRRLMSRLSSEEQDLLLSLCARLKGATEEPVNV